MIHQFEDRNEIRLSQPQFDLVFSPAKFPAFVGGLGSGKTEALTTRALRLKLEYPTCNIAYYLPTFDLVDLIVIPRLEEKLEEMNAAGNHVPYKTVRHPRPSIYIEGCGQIILRTMDNPTRIVGYEVADSFVDELDIMSIANAQVAWQKIIARNRQKKPDGRKNTVAVGTTPEGFRFTYDRWKKNPDARKKGYQLIKASTYSNQGNLPYGYIDTLMEDYPLNLRQAMIDGEFVNLTSGAVYPDFDRNLNFCNTVIEGPKFEGQKGETLHIGLDFNVTNMTAIIWRKVGDECHAVDEITGVYDTPAMIKILDTRFKGRHDIAIYPDSSGDARKSVNASKSDIVLLNEAGYPCYFKPKNPHVKDRVLAMNVRICNGKEQRRLKVNINKCPKFTHALETQAYNEQGEPDKSTGVDHQLDAGGYFVAYTYPVSETAAKRIKLAGI